MISSNYLPRLVDPLLSKYFSVFPALLLTGPRAAGKTTTARRHAQTVIRLDSEAEAEAFRADPDAALRSFPEPILLDEWQATPGILGAVKRAVDDDPRPGRFILTGSVRADLTQATWPGTGRLVRIPMFGLSVREVRVAGGGSTFLEKLSLAKLDGFTLPIDPPDLYGYVSLALQGGFPDTVLRLPANFRQPWVDSYLEQLLTRDVEMLEHLRDPARLRRYFEVLALNTAGLSEAKTLYDSALIDRKTALAYDQLLINLQVLELMPAWTKNRLLRLVRTAKRYLLEPSLIASALQLDERAVLRDGELLGRLIDTFVAAQIRPELILSHPQP
ncbi:MAG: ATP-binding protein, partial [Candidatus Dormibacteraceae bacterium]